MVRVAVIGAGHWGPRLMRCFARSDRAELAWVVDRRADRLEAVAREFPRARLSTEATVPCLDPSVHAVVLATPTSTHLELARLALQSDKHVLVEKPFGTDAAAVLGLGELARARGRVLMAGYVYLYHPAVAWIRDHLASGAAGGPRLLSFHRLGFGPVRDDVGAGWDLSAHDVAMAFHWLGARPSAVSATAGAWLRAGVPDLVTATLRFPGEVLVTLQASWLHPRKVRLATLVGTRQMLGFDDTRPDGPVAVYPRKVTVGREGEVTMEEGPVARPALSHAEPLLLEVEHFLTCVLTGQAPRTGAAFAAQVIRTVAAMDRSMAAHGKEVEP